MATAKRGGSTRQKPQTGSGGAGGSASGYESAVADLAKLCGSAGKAMKGAAGGFTFDVAPARRKSLRLDRAHADFLARGCYVYGADADGRRVGVLPTTDPYAVVRAVGTSGPNWGVGVKDVIAFLRKLKKDQPFTLTAVAEDFVGGRFEGKVRNPEDLAYRLLEFCPDLENPVEVERELRRGELRLWWS